jgi:hypothetical protein
MLTAMVVVFIAQTNARRVAAAIAISHVENTEGGRG